MTTNLTGITIAIVTYNGANRIKDTLSYISLIRNTYKINWEVLIVDNASTDDTVNIAKEFWKDKQNIPLRIITEKKQGAIHARLTAIKNANYSYLSFVDDDNWISDNWIDEIWNIFQSYSNVGIISCGAKPANNIHVKNCDLNIQDLLATKDQYDKEGIVTDSIKSFWTAGTALRLSAVNKLFDIGFKFCLTGRKGNIPIGGEDHELCHALTLLNWKSYYSKKIFFKHYIPPQRLNIEYLKNMIYQQGKSRPILGIYRKALDYRQPNIIKRILETIYFYFKFSIINLFRNNKNLDGYKRLYLMYKGTFAGYIIHIDKFLTAKNNIVKLRSFK